MVSLSLLSSHTNHDYPGLQGQKKVQVLVVYTWQFNLKKPSPWNQYTILIYLRHKIQAPHFLPAAVDSHHAQVLHYTCHGMPTASKWSLVKARGTIPSFLLMDLHPAWFHPPQLLGCSGMIRPLLLLVLGHFSCHMYSFFYSRQATLQYAH